MAEGIKNGDFMRETHDMTKASKKFHNKVKSFCDPLVQLFGINHFYHAKVTNAGHFIGLNLNPGWEEFFFSDKTHLLIWPDKCLPRKVKEGVRFLQEDENENFNKLLKTAKEEYSLNFSLQIVEKTPQGTDMYGFALNSQNPHQHMVLINEIPLLRLFIKRFQEEFKPLYAALNDNKVDMPSLLGPQFFKAKVPAITRSFMRDQFLQKMGIEIPSLTDREIEVIKYLIQGYSASQLAAELFISKRTAEHHIERIKYKFNSFSKSELIRKIRELESIGYFMF